MSHFLIFDAHAIIHRAYHALPPLKTSDGRQINAVYGFLLVFLKVLKEFEPRHIAVCFDPAGKTFRDKLAKDYKANRLEIDRELNEQFPYVKDVVEAFDVPIIEVENYEADDCIGTLAVWARANLADERVIIVTGDMDTLQLVEDRVSVYTLRKGMSDTVLMTPDVVRERYGIEPGEIVSWKALKGDASDNISGVSGIGERTATGLIQQFHSLENLYKHVGDVESPSVRKKLEAGEKDARLSFQLATIETNVPVKISEQDLEFRGLDEDRVVKKFQQYHFHSLIAKIPSLREHGELIKVKSQKSKVKSKDNGSASSDQKGVTVFESCGRAGGVQISLFEDLSKKKLEELKRGWHERGLVTRIYRDQQQNPTIVLFSHSCAVLVRADDVRKLREDLLGILSSHEIKKIGHGLKEDYKILNSFGINLSPLWFDCEIAGYVLDAGKRSYELPQLAAVYLGEPHAENKDRQWSDEAVSECRLIWKLSEAMGAELGKRKHTELFHSFDMPLVSVLARMELAGILLDVGYLKRLGSVYDERLKAYQRKILKLAGMEFNVNSPKQLKEVLFEKLGISARNLGRTKTGISTGAEELEKIRDEHPIVPLVLAYRELFKLQSTYVLALPKAADSQKRVHTTFNQTIAATGRLSSQDPNLQNIPIRGEEGVNLRRAFIAARGWKLISADYSQFELRVVASLSRDPVLTAAFKSGGDIHAKTASVIFSIPEKKVTPQQRRDAKVINFGIIYGLGARGLAGSTGMTVPEAKEFIRKYFEIHTGVKKFFENILKDGREKGYVETLFGRRRYLPDLNAPQEFLRSAAERQALNHPIQGSQADLLKLAMIHLHRRLTEEKLLDRVHMLLQVHDELVFEVADGAVARAREIIHHELVHVYKLWVPIEVEIGVGHSWAECHK